MDAKDTKSITTIDHVDLRAAEAPVGLKIETQALVMTGWQNTAVTTLDFVRCEIGKSIIPRVACQIVSRCRTVAQLRQYSLWSCPREDRAPGS